MQFITEQKFYKFYPKAPPGLFKEIQNLAHLGGISTQEQLAAFIAQCAHESGGFQKFQEQLNYSSQGLLKTFPKYFDKAKADKFGYQKNSAGVVIKKADQAGIANIVYSNRMGNGNALTGDGWKYRGRGLIQLTGKYNYTKFQEWLNDPEVLQNPDKILTSQKLIVLTAIWFWKENNLAAIKDIQMLSKRINGGTIGLQDRIHEYTRLMA